MSRAPFTTRWRGHQHDKIVSVAGRHKSLTPIKHSAVGVGPIRTTTFIPVIIGVHPRTRFMDIYYAGNTWANSCSWMCKSGSKLLTSINVMPVIVCNPYPIAILSPSRTVGCKRERKHEAGESHVECIAIVIVVVGVSGLRMFDFCGSPSPSYTFPALTMESRIPPKCPVISLLASPPLTSWSLCGPRRIWNQSSLTSTVNVVIMGLCCDDQHLGEIWSDGAVLTHRRQRSYTNSQETAERSPYMTHVSTPCTYSRVHVVRYDVHIEYFKSSIAPLVSSTTNYQGMHANGVGQKSERCTVDVGSCARSANSATAQSSTNWVWLV